jgi:hypothetical protein
MTTQQALNAIESHLERYIDDVPQRLLNKIAEVITQTKTIVKREVILPDRSKEIPDLEKTWIDICRIHDIDPVLARKGRQHDRVGARAHFVRHILLNYETINISQMARFFNNDHTKIMNLRDKSKAPSPIPPFYQKKIVMVKG